MAILEINSISKNYDSLEALKNVTFSINEGEIVSFIGESGSGKSTLLKCIIGAIKLNSGNMYFNGKDISLPELTTFREHLNYVNQEDDLDPFATVHDNVGRFYSNIDLSDKEERINKLLSAIKLSDKKYEKIIHLSGGQKQRVAIARSLAKMPKLLLLDEPFSNLDFNSKKMLRDPLFELLKQNKTSVLMMTHDMKDALGFSDKIGILYQGNLIQFDTPYSLYKNPKNSYVAELFDYINLIQKDGKSYFCYPNDLVENSNGYKATVLKSHFEGSSFLHTVLLNGNTMKFRDFSEKKINTQIHLQIENLRSFQS